MRRPWSISTTVRNPDRLRGLLAVLQQLEGEKWNADTQRRYQIMLIQHRLYGYGNAQFYNGLPARMVALMNDTTRELSFSEAEKMFNARRYEDPAMRGRQSFNPLNKFGLAAVQDGILRITPLGQLLTQDTCDYGEVFFKSFLKWQFPNPMLREYTAAQGYNLKPFLATLHLIRAVNEKEAARGKKAVGLRTGEFCLFVPTLQHYQHIDATAEKIVALRDALDKARDAAQHRAAYERKFAAAFLDTQDDRLIRKLLSNLKDYGDNTIRYFRLTRYLHLRGNGRYVDLEPRREVEINALLAADTAQAAAYASRQAYLSHLCDLTQPPLPWETKPAYRQIVQTLIKEVRDYEKRLNKPPAPFPPLRTLSEAALKKQAQHLRGIRQQLQEEELSRKSESTTEVERCITLLDGIFKQTNRPVLLEKLSAFGLQALNDALKIQPNYPVGDDNEPTFTAPAHRADIECFYEGFSAICEVTMLTNRNQWFNEGQPVMRHLRDFEKQHRKLPAYCLFIAPKLHRDTLNTFWVAVKYEYESEKQRIIPLRICDFTAMLKTLLALRQRRRSLRHTDLHNLYARITQASTTCSGAVQWATTIPDILAAWQEELLA